MSKKIHAHTFSHKTIITKKNARAAVPEDLTPALHEHVGENAVSNKQEHRKHTGRVQSRRVDFVLAREGRGVHDLAPGVHGDDEEPIAHNHAAPDEKPQRQRRAVLQT